MAVRLSSVESCRAGKQSESRRRGGRGTSRPDTWWPSQKYALRSADLMVTVEAAWRQGLPQKRHIRQLREPIGMGVEVGGARSDKVVSEFDGLELKAVEGRKVSAKADGGGGEGEDKRGDLTLSVRIVWARVPFDCVK